MALEKNTVRDSIEDLHEQVFGEADAAKREKFCDFLAEVFLEVLKNHAEVKSTGNTGTGSPGGPLPILDLPGGIE